MALNAINSVPGVPAPITTPLRIGDTLTTLRDETQPTEAPMLDAPQPRIVDPMERQAKALLEKTRYVKHAAIPRKQVDRAIETLFDDFQGIQQQIAAIRPDIDAASWDFSYRDGRLVVQGATLRKQDKAWIEQQLNDNTSLVEAARNFNEMATLYFQETPDNKLLRGETSNDVTIRRSLGCFHFETTIPGPKPAAFAGVTRQIEDGAIPFKALIHRGLDKVRRRSEGGIGIPLTAEQVDFLQSGVHTRLEKQRRHPEL
ncbi:hypothetical protein [Chitinimonas naiadis]